MRLTLRTLLAYLDDTLEPAQAKIIGQKVAENEAARELMDKIKQVTRRRRLTTPPASSNLNPNTIAEYLDNEVSAEQATEVEQICLSSDVHLAEVAACHQILTLVLGEPLAPPPSAHQRMYGLVKGPEAIPFRKPAGAHGKAHAEPSHDHRDVDDTLRLGIPPVGRKSSLTNKILLFGGGFLAACLLIFALIQVLGGNNNGDKKDIVKADPKKDPGKEEIKDVLPEPKKLDPDKKDPDVKDPPDPKMDDTKDPPKVDFAPPPDVPFAPPDAKQKAVGQIVLGEFGKEPTFLFQQTADKADWQRLGSRNADVFSNRPLMSLPASRSSVQIGKAMHLTLWGNMMELVPAPVYESMVELHPADALDADLTLRRGRIVLTATRGDRPAQARVRFDNPTPSDTPDYFDITLYGKNTAVLVDYLGAMPPNEPFYPNPKNSTRLGPLITVGCVVLHGNASVKYHDVTHGLSAPPGNTILVWSNREGLKGPYPLKELPPIVLADPPLPEKADPKPRKDMVFARAMLDKDMFKQNLSVALKENAELSQDASRRRLAVRCLAALDDLDTLLDIAEPTNFPDQRKYILQTLREWIALDNHNDYKLFDRLKERYKGFQAGAIMKLMHLLTEAELRRPETYDFLIDCLVNPNLLIRELGALHLYQLAPIGKDIPYRADGDSAIRDRAHALWRSRIPPGQLPPAGLPPKKM